MTQKNILWKVIVLDEPDQNSGGFMIELLNFLHQNIFFEHILMGDIEGPYVYQIPDNLEHHYYNLEQLISLIKNEMLFEWGNIFCYKEKVDVPVNFTSLIDYPEVINGTELTILIVDDGGIEIFTRSEKLCKLLMKKYISKRYYEGDLSDYEFMW
jgi:hypothetical protein